MILFFQCLPKLSNILCFLKVLRGLKCHKSCFGYVFKISLSNFVCNHTHDWTNCTQGGGVMGMLESDYNLLCRSRGVLDKNLRYLLNSSYHMKAIFNKLFDY